MRKRTRVMVMMMGETNEEAEMRALYLHSPVESSPHLTHQRSLLASKSQKVFLFITTYEASSISSLPPVFLTCPQMAVDRNTQETQWRKRIGNTCTPHRKRATRQPNQSISFPPPSHPFLFFSSLRFEKLPRSCAWDPDGRERTFWAFRCIYPPAPFPNLFDPFFTTTLFLLIFLGTWRFETRLVGTGRDHEE